MVLARHEATGTLVAIKYLRRELLAGPGFAAGFRAEAVVLASLADVNVVRLYEYVESPAGAAIVMELVDASRCGNLGPAGRHHGGGGAGADSRGAGLPRGRRVRCHGHLLRVPDRRPAVRGGHRPGARPAPARPGAAGPGPGAAAAATQATAITRISLLRRMLVWRLASSYPVVRAAAAVAGAAVVGTVAFHVLHKGNGTLTTIRLRSGHPQRGTTINLGANTPGGIAADPSAIANPDAPLEQRGHANRNRDRVTPTAATHPW